MKSILKFKRLAMWSFYAFILTVGLSCASVTSSSPNDHTISMINTQYTPSTITILKGETITWTNDDHEVHTATSDAGEGSWDSGDIHPGESRSITFYSTGTYPYHCTYHVSMGMRGTIIVK